MSNVLLCLKEAEAFLKTSYFCDGQEIIDESYIFPNVVNLSFAGELYLKALLMMTNKNGGYRRKHELNSLFLSLEPEVQREIETQYCADKTCHSMHVTLESHSDHFKKWRYAFETKEALTVHLTDLGSLVRAIKNVAESFYDTQC